MSKQHPVILLVLVLLGIVHLAHGADQAIALAALEFNDPSHNDASAIEELTSKKLKDFALDRLAAIFPEMRGGVPDSITVSAVPSGPTTLLVLCKCVDPVYAKRHLDSLLDEFHALQKTKGRKWDEVMVLLRPVDAATLPFDKFEAWKKSSKQ